MPAQKLAPAAAPLRGQILLARIAQHPNRWAFFSYAVLSALFYVPLLLGVRTFPDGDFTHHFLPFSLFQLENLRHGQLPLWNPYTYAGHPFLADIQAAVFYPLSNLFLLLTWPWTAAGPRLYFLQLEAIVHVWLAGFFVYLLVRDLTGRTWAAFLAGCCFAYSGYLTGYPPLQLAILRTAIWLPLLLWLIRRGFDAPQRWRWWIGAALVYATAFLAGHPQTFLHLSYALAAYCLLRIVLAVARGTHPIARVLFGLLVFLFLAVALTAAQWLPSLEFTRLSVRANVDYAFVSGGLPLQDSWQLLLPGVLTQFSPLYIGVIGLGLAGIGIAQGRTGLAARSTDLLFYLGVTLLALLLTYGDHAFLYPLFYRFAPGWNLFRGQERTAFLVALGLSVLAGFGAAALDTIPLRLRRWLALLIVGLAAMGVYAFGLFWQFFGRSAIGQGQYLLIALITLTLVAALTVLLRLPGWSPARSGLVIGLALLNLFWANVTTNLADFGPARKTILAPEVSALEQAVTERATANLGLPGRVYNEARVYEDYGMRSHVEDVWGSSPLRLANYARLFENFPLDRMWQLTGVEHLLTWRRELFTPNQSTVLAEFPQTNDTTYLQRLTAQHPRAWVVARIQPATDEEALQRLADHQFDLATTALFPTDALADPAEVMAGDASIQLTRLASNRLRVNVESEQGGLLVISENWMPDWRVEKVECDAQPSCESPLAGVDEFTVYRTNLTFLGVPIPAGRLQFELHYWPRSVQLGLWISCGAVALLALLLLWRWRRKVTGSA